MKVEPCPACGGEAKPSRCYHEAGQPYRVRCIYCDHGVGFASETAEGAVKSWNDEYTKVGNVMNKPDLKCQCWHLRSEHRCGVCLAFNDATHVACRCWRFKPVN